MLSRRAFLRRAAVAASALAIADDPERLLWTPGVKTISIPKVSLAFDRHAYARAFAKNVRIQELYNAMLTQQVQTLARHGLPPPRWFPDLNS